MALHSKESPPPDTIAAAITISQKSQETFISWIGPHLSGKRRVTITEQDRAKNPDTNFDELLANIEHYRDSMKSENPQVKAIEATYRIWDAVISEETEGVAEVLGIAAVAGLVAHALEQNGMSPAVYATASTLDNSFEMIAESIKLKKSGVSTRETLLSMTPSLAVLLSAAGLATQVHAAFGENMPVKAGVLYGAESGICVMPSLGAVVMVLRKKYITMVQEGKIDDARLKRLLDKESPTLKDKLNIFLRSSEQALFQDLRYPHHAGIYLGATLGIGLSAIAASIPTGEGRYLLQHPVALSTLGVADSIGGTLAGMLTHEIYAAAKHRALAKLIASKPQIR